VLRPFNVYGPRQTGEGAIRNFCVAAVTGVPLEVYGDGSAVRAWCYVEDFVAAAASTLTTPDAVGQIFNIGNPDGAIDTNGLAELIASMAPGSQVSPGHVSHAEVPYRTPVIEKARKILAYEPRVDLYEGLRRTLEWTRSEFAQEAR
jgi:nucleoside-diphosphate-sugar epimerase